MGPETDLVSHCAGQSPHGGFFAGQFDHTLLQAVDGFVACRVVHVVLEGGFDHGLRYKISPNSTYTIVSS